MKRKGFTLIELLAVIVVIAVIALIATPTILGVIENARKGAFKDSVYGIIESADLYIASNFGVQDSEFICNGKKCYMDKKELSFKGETPISGTVKIENNKVSVSFLSNGRYCANGTRQNLKISEDCISLDETPAEIIGKVSYTSTTNSITIIIPREFAIDKESGIKEYEVTLNNETKKIEYDGKEKIIIFNNLKQGTKYEGIIKVINNNNNEKEVKIETETLAFNKPNIELINDPTSAVNGYVKNQVASVTYNGTNIANPIYFIKTTRAGTSSVAVTSSCGTGTVAGACTTITSTTSLAANTWYKVSGNLNVTYNTTATSTDTIYAMTYDGTNYSGSITGTISKIDTSNPSVPTIVYNGGSNTCSWKNNYNLTLSSTDTGIGIDHYEIDTDGNGTKDGNVLANYIPGNGVHSHNVKFRAVDKLGNVSGWTTAQHIHMDTEAPVHTEWWWGEVNNTVARLYVRTTDNIGIQRVQCPTSTASGGFGNWVWFNATWDSSASAYRCDITPATFGHYGQEYRTQLYIYDHAANGGYYNLTAVSIPLSQKSGSIPAPGVPGYFSDVNGTAFNVAGYRTCTMTNISGGSIVVFSQNYGGGTQIAYKYTGSITFSVEGYSTIYVYGGVGDGTGTVGTINYTLYP